MTKKFFHFDLIKTKTVKFNIFRSVTLFVFGAIYFQCIQAYSQEGDSLSQTSIKGHASIRGQASITDGDTIVISFVKIRLIGIDAPETRQLCGTKKEQYACGLEAKKYLTQLIANQPVTCYWEKRDRYNRLLATCQTKEVHNINATMVREGWAVSYYDYSKEEQEAKKRKNGIWRSEFQQPREWRRMNLKR
ncbi:thermonuclease family protein [Bartonella sp. CB175]|uniref:thermonuclease family protein n=1 Tax=Bartonella sp. CB175 TaxID=3112256 RepID=UPI00300E6284